MTPEEIISEARADGVNLTICNGELKVSGDTATVDQWLGSIREHKAAIIEVLKGDTTSTPLTVNEETAIRAWLDSIGEDASEIIDEVIEACRRNLDRRAYFLGRARTENAPQMHINPAVPLGNLTEEE